MNHAGAACGTASPVLSEPPHEMTGPSWSGRAGCAGTRNGSRRRTASCHSDAASGSQPRWFSSTRPACTQWAWSGPSRRSRRCCGQQRDPRLPGGLPEKGLPRIHCNDLRHGCAPLLLAQGVHAQVVMETLGHSAISLTMNTYSQRAGRSSGSPRSRSSKRCAGELGSAGPPRRWGNRLRHADRTRNEWWARWASNPGPADYESAALTN